MFRVLMVVYDSFGASASTERIITIVPACAPGLWLCSGQCVEVDCTTFASLSAAAGAAGALMPGLPTVTLSALTHHAQLTQVVVSGTNTTTHQVAMSQFVALAMQPNDPAYNAQLVGGASQSDPAWWSKVLPAARRRSALGSLDRGAGCNDAHTACLRLPSPNMDAFLGHQGVGVWPPGPMAPLPPPPPSLTYTQAVRRGLAEAVSAGHMLDALPVFAGRQPHSCADHLIMAALGDPGHSADKLPGACAGGHGLLWWLGSVGLYGPAHDMVLHMRLALMGAMAAADALETSTEGLMAGGRTRERRLHQGMQAPHVLQPVPEVLAAVDPHQRAAQMLGTVVQAAYDAELTSIVGPGLGHNGQAEGRDGFKGRGRSLVAGEGRDEAGQSISSSIGLDRGSWLHDTNSRAVDAWLMGMTGVGAGQQGVDANAAALIQAARRRAFATSAWRAAHPQVAANATLTAPVVNDVYPNAEAFADRTEAHFAPPPPGDGAAMMRRRRLQQQATVTPSPGASSHLFYPIGATIPPRMTLERCPNVSTSATTRCGVTGADWLTRDLSNRVGLLDVTQVGRGEMCVCGGGRSGSAPGPWCLENS